MAAAPEPSEDDADAVAAPGWAGDGGEMAAETVVERLRLGQPVQNARIGRLALTGEFPLPVVLDHVSIQRLSVSGATFAQGLAIRHSEVRRGHVGGQLKVGLDLDLRGTRVGRLDLGEAEIGRDLRLDGVIAEQMVRINRCAVAGVVRFWQGRFQDWVECNGCRVGGKADLRSFHAAEGMIFRECHFAGEFLLRGSTVTKKLEFSGCRMEGLTDFSKAKLHDVVYLDGIEPGPGQSFAFENALFTRLLVEPDKLKGRLASENHGHHRAAMMEYGLLKQNYQHLNRYEDEDWAFYRFKVNQRKARPTSWWKPWTKVARFLDYWLLDAGCGYGAKPFRAVTTAFVLMALFAGIYAGGIDRLDVPRAPWPDLPVTHPVNRALFGAMTSVSVFTAGFSGEHLRAAEGWILVPLAVEALAGTLLWGLFIVAFSRKVIR
jgi:hypothetical protein